MFTSRTLACWVVVWSLAAPSVCLAAEASSSEETHLRERLGELIEQLGSSQFQVREQAARELTKIGLPARDALVEGMKEANVDVHLGCERILAMIQEQDFQRRLEEFAADVEGYKEHDLPGWKRYVAVTGSNPNSRALFVEMQRAERDLLETCESDPANAPQTFLLRCQQMMLQMRVPNGRGAELIRMPSVAALLFVASDEKVNLQNGIQSQLYNLCVQAPFQTAMKDGKTKEPLRNLLAAWIQRDTDDATAYQILLFAMQYDIKEGIPRAQKMLSRGESTAQYLRQYAILAIAKLGDESNIPDLEKLLNDRAVCYTSSVNRVMRQTQVRDVALAGAIHLAKQKHSDFGFKGVQPHPQMLFNPGSLWFTNEDERKAALEKWQAYRKAQAKPEAPAKADETAAKK